MTSDIDMILETFCTAIDQAWSVRKIQAGAELMTNLISLKKAMA